MNKISIGKKRISVALQKICLKAWESLKRSSVSSDLAGTLTYI